MSEIINRLTCRDENGGFRLVPGANIMDALDKLGAYEEQELGHLVIRTASYRLGDGYKCRDCKNYSGPAIGCGICMVHPARDKHRMIVGPHRPVQAARLACSDKFDKKNKEGDEAGA